MTGYQYDPMLWPTLGSAAFLGAIALYIWSRREARGAVPLAVVAFLLVAWCLCAAAEVAAVDTVTKASWFLVRDAMTLPGVILSLWFALEYAGLRRWLTRPVVGILVAALVVHLSLYFYDGGRLLWSSLWWDGEIRGDRGPMGLAFGALATGMFFLGTAVLALLFVRSPAHRVPVALILVGQIALRVVYPLAVFNVMYVSNIPAAVVSFDLLAVMYTIALFRFRLFDLVPVARETIVRRMPNAMLVLDVHDRVADMNDAAARLLDLHVGDALRRPVAEVLGRFPGLVERIAQARATPAATTTLDAHVGPRTCEVTSTPLTDWQGLPIGRLVLLHETTSLRRVEAQLVERERALAAAQEREWVARELHDGLAQDLWLAKLKIGRLAGLPGLGPDATALAAEVGAAVDAGLAEARQAVATMRVGGPESGTLKELLARSLDDFGDQFGLRVDFECDGPLPALSPRAEAEALRIAQEALTNVRRHADATTVTVEAGSEDGRLVLTIRDNGRGFDPSIVGDAAYGLASMRERASLIGGALAIESAPRQGTAVRLTIPLATPGPVAAGVA